MAGPLDSIQQSILNGVEATANFLKPAADAVLGAVDTITAPETKAQGDAAKIKQSQYDYTYLQYPSDLGEGLRHPYYMTFYILVQDLSKWSQGVSQGAPVGTSTINASTTRTLAKNANGTNLGFGRKTHRTKSAIRLYMPDTLSWSYNNSFRDVSLSGLPGVREAQALASLPQFAKSLTDNHKGGGIMGLLSSLNTNTARGTTGPLAEVAGNFLFGEGGDRIALQAIGVALNPQIDVIYESPSLREFTFDFLFAPRDEFEAAMVSDIITEFKFHAAPEILGQGIGIGRYFVPPSEFDIEFSVDTMGKISSCVLQGVTVDYAPSGSAFYANGKPVYTRLTLTFKELEFITKELIRDKGF